jgi:CTP:molybdopterin cytidylyltransferase MocA
MTVAAVILAAAPASALADADGLPRIRRIVDAAWAGGAIPIVVVSFDPDGEVARALAGAPVTLAEPAPRETGPVGQMVRGIEVAVGLVAETDAALIWPARFGWVGPETVTSLLEAHGGTPDALARPSFLGEAGWPALVPMTVLDRLRALAPDRMPPDVLDDLAVGGAPVRLVDLGDPGTVIDGDTARGDLPAYDGPPEPPSDQVHEWGAEIADLPEDAPEAPRTVPYPER